MRRLYLVLFMILMIGLVSAKLPTVKLGNGATSSTTIINSTISNQSNFWDDLDTPNDIVGSKYWYNQSSSFYTWLSSFIYNYNQTGNFNYNQTYIGGTYNSTYDKYAYNMTIADEFSYNMSDGSYNITYDTWAYNQSDGIGSGNLTFNQTLTDELYTGIIYNYNQSLSFYNWLSSFVYNYNQTGNYNYNQTYIDGTFNQTYDDALIYAYNMTDGVGDGNLTWNETRANDLYTGIIYNYNQSDGSYNLTYAEFSYNQSQFIIDTYGIWFYNMTTAIAESDPIFLAENASLWLEAQNKYNSTYDGFLDWAYNQTYMDGTYNVTYDKWAYNMTDGIGSGNLTWNETRANDLYASINYNYNETYTGGTYNSSYDSALDYAYNQTGDYGYNQTYIDGTYNSSYDSALIYAYNMTDGVGEGNVSWNQSYADTLYSDILWSYNQSDGYLSDYDYNMSDGVGTGNLTFNQTFTDSRYFPYSGATNNLSLNGKFIKSNSDIKIYPSGSSTIYTQFYIGSGGALINKNLLATSDDELYYDGDFNPTLTNKGSLGTSSYKWKTLYLSQNASIDGNVSASYYFGDGSQLTGISGGNESWNESHANTLYSDIQWNYNQTDGYLSDYDYNMSDGSYNSTYEDYYNEYSQYWYNMSEDCVFCLNHSQYIIDTYSQWFYNQTDGYLSDFDYNMTDGYLSDYDYNHTSVIETEYGQWFYNQTTGFVEDTTWHYNMTDGYLSDYDYNMSTPYDTYNYNMTDGYLSEFDYNMTYTDGTYNETYDKWAYNMSDGDGGDYNYNETTYIENTYGQYFYNMTDGYLSDFDYNMTDGFLSDYDYNHSEYIETEYSQWFYNMTDGVGEGGNSSWNQSYAETLFANIDYSYNQTTVLNATEFEFTDVWTITLTWLSEYLDTWLGTKTTDNLNQGDDNLYDNQTWSEERANTLYETIGSGGNSSWNESYADTLYADITYGYNMTDGYLSDFDYNMSTPYDTFNYNMTDGYLSDFDYNMTDGSYNVTYDEKVSFDKTNVAYVNESNTFTDDQIIGTNKLCGDAGCTKYIQNNGTAWIIQS